MTFVLCPMFRGSRSQEVLNTILEVECGHMARWHAKSVHASPRVGIQASAPSDVACAQVSPPEKGWRK